MSGLTSVPNRTIETFVDDKVENYATPPAVNDSFLDLCTRHSILTPIGGGGKEESSTMEFRTSIQSSHAVSLHRSFLLLDIQVARKAGTTLSWLREQGSGGGALGMLGNAERIDGSSTAPLGWGALLSSLNDSQGLLCGSTYVTSNPARVFKDAQLLLNSTLVENVNDVGVITDYKMTCLSKSAVETNMSDVFILPIDTMPNGFPPIDKFAKSMIQDYSPCVNDQLCVIRRPNILADDVYDVALNQAFKASLGDLHNSYYTRGVCGGSMEHFAEIHSDVSSFHNAIQAVSTDAPGAPVVPNVFIPKRTQLVLGRATEWGPSQLSEKISCFVSNSRTVFNISGVNNPDGITQLGAYTTNIERISPKIKQVRIPLSYIFGFAEKDLVIPGGQLIQLNFTRSKISDFLRSTNNWQPGVDYDSKTSIASMDESNYTMSIEKARCMIVHFPLKNESAKILNQDKLFLVPHYRAVSYSLPAGEANFSLNLQTYAGLRTIVLRFANAKYAPWQSVPPAQEYTPLINYRGVALPLSQQSIKIGDVSLDRLGPRAFAVQHATAGTYEGYNPNEEQLLVAYNTEIVNNSTTAQNRLRALKTEKPCGASNYVFYEMYSRHTSDASGMSAGVTTDYLYNVNDWLKSQHQLIFPIIEDPDSESRDTESGNTLLQLQMVSGANPWDLVQQDRTVHIIFVRTNQISYSASAGTYSFLTNSSS